MNKKFELKGIWQEVYQTGIYIYIYDIYPDIYSWWPRRTSLTDHSVLLNREGYQLYITGIYMFNIYINITYIFKKDIIYI